jgi:hypothetical protein
MKISIKRRGKGVFAGVFALVSTAAWALFYPAVQITAGPTPAVNLCSAAPFNLPVLLNTSTTNSLNVTMFVAGVGTVLNASIALPTLNGPTTLNINPPAYTGAAGAAVTIIARTFNSTNASGGEAYESTLVFNCTTGAITSLVSGALAIPTMSEWALGTMALLLALAGGMVLYRRRARF